LEEIDKSPILPIHERNAKSNPITYVLPVTNKRQLPKS